MKHQNIEEALLGYIVRTGDQSPLSEVKVEHFTNEFTQALYTEIIKSLNTNHRVDFLLLAEKLDPVKVSQCVTTSIDIFHWQPHVKMLKNAYLLREADRAMDTFKRSDKEASERVSALYSTLIDLSGERKHGTIHDTFDEIESNMAEYALAVQQGRNTIGIPTGYDFLDKKIDGFIKNEMWVVSAVTSAGKSFFALNLMHQLLKQGKRVVFFSLEMSNRQIVNRLIALETGLPISLVEKSGISDEWYQKYLQGKNALSQYDFELYDECYDINDIRVSMNAEHAKKKVDVFFVDYIQNISFTKPMDEYQLITYVNSKLRAMNSKLGTTLVAVSQISNDDAKHGKILSIQGKGSGSIKSASDVFIYLKYDTASEEELLGYYATGDDIPISVIISKNRQGLIGSKPMKRIQSTGKIYEI